MRGSLRESLGEVGVHAREVGSYSGGIDVAVAVGDVVLGVAQKILDAFKREARCEQDACIAVSGLVRCDAVEARSAPGAISALGHRRRRERPPILTAEDIS
ncbi:MAG TPA: hypothetical protein VFY02_03945, partial [Gaiellaceae bacterium]|nr:hypothetical protein [Gaiellaceae bacterium]